MSEAFGIYSGAAVTGHRRSRSSVFGIIALLCALAGLTACENAVDPFERSGEDRFAVYGYLDAEADTQYIRVSPVVDRQGDRWPPVLDAAVTTTNTSIGEQLTWTPSTVELEGGTASYVYYAAFTPVRGHSYRLDVTGHREDSTTAFTQVPAGGRFIINSPSRGIGNRVIQSIVWPDEASPEEVVVHYFVRALDLGVRDSLSFPYRDPSPTADDDWSVLVQLQSDYDRVESSVVDKYGPTEIALTGIALTAFVPSADWARDEGRNIENGHGFFGSVARVRVTWRIDDATAEQIGYVTP